MFKLREFQTPPSEDEIPRNPPGPAALTFAWLVWLAGVGGAFTLNLIWGIFRWVCLGYGPCQLDFTWRDGAMTALIAGVGLVGGALVAFVLWLLLSRRRHALAGVASRSAVAAAALPISYLVSVLGHLALFGAVERNPGYATAGVWAASLAVFAVLIAPTRP
jgi:hypothetical protein